MSLEIQSFPSSSLRLKSVTRRVVACLYHKTTTELQRKVWWYGPPEMYGSSCIVCPNKFWIFMPKSKANVLLKKYWIALTTFIGPLVDPLDYSLDSQCTTTFQALVRKLNTSVSFEETALGFVEHSKIFAAKISLVRSSTVTLSLCLCNQKRRFSIHCNFVITLVISYNVKLYLLETQTSSFLEQCCIRFP